MRSWVRVTSVAMAVTSAVFAGCSDDADDVDESDATPALSMEEFCLRWNEVGELQTSGDGATAAMELARLSLAAPDEVSEPVEVLYELLEDRLAGDEIDFDAMLDASLEIDEACG